MSLKNRIACRICLSTNVKFYHLEAFQLKSYYEEITSKVLPKDDKLLHFFCYQCSAMLQKYHSFRELCIKSQKSLKKIITQNSDVPFEVTLKCEQNNNKIQPWINKLDGNSNLGYFEYKEIDIKVDESDHLDDQFASDPIEHAEYLNISFDNDGCFEPKYSVVEHNYDYNKVEFDESTKQESKYADQPVSDKEEKYSPKEAKPKKIDKRSNRIRNLDHTKWKVVILSKEEALEQFHEKNQKRKDVCSKYFCEYCQRGFKDYVWLMRHNMSCHNEANGQFECFLCKKRFTTKYKLDTHTKLHLVKYHCLQCPQVFSDKHHTFLHDKYHEGVQYVCEICDAKFLKRSSYYGHLRNRHRSSHLCQFCGASFVNELGLKHHKMYIHKSDDTANDGIYCKLCDMKFENPQAFIEHERNSDKHATDEDDVVLRRSKTLLKGSTFQICEECGEHFWSSMRYTRHLQLVHNMRQKKPVNIKIPNPMTMCEICGSTLLLSQLPVHMYIHEGIRFPCPDCNKDFSNPANMQKHRRLHIDAKPFRCELCSKNFSSKSAVQLHVRTVHLKQSHPPRSKRVKFRSLGKKVKCQEE